VGLVYFPEKTFSSNFSSDFIVSESVQNKDLDLDLSTYWADAGTVGEGGAERRPNEESNSFSYLSKPAAAAMPVAKIERMESAKKIWTRNLFYRTFFPKMRGVLFLAPKATRTTFAKDTGTMSRQGLTV